MAYYPGLPPLHVKEVSAPQSLESLVSAGQGRNVPSLVHPLQESSLSCPSSYSPTETVLKDLEKAQEKLNEEKRRKDEFLARNRMAGTFDIQLSPAFFFSCLYTFLLFFLLYELNHIPMT